MKKTVFIALAMLFAMSAKAQTFSASYDNEPLGPTDTLSLKAEEEDFEFKPHFQNNSSHNIIARIEIETLNETTTRVMSTCTGLLCMSGPASAPFQILANSNYTDTHIDFMVPEDAPMGLFRVHIYDTVNPNNETQFFLKLYNKNATVGISDVAEYGDNVDKMSQKMGISAEAYQEWDAVMQHSGTSMETLKTSMKTLATAAETGNEAFAKIGLTQEEIAGMNQEQLFEATLRGLQGVEDETQRMYLAGQLLGRGATELGPLLNTSAAEVDAMRQRVHELGGVMSDEAVKASAAYQDTLQDMNTALQGLQRNLLAEFLPGITSVMGGLTEIFTGNSEGGIQMISEGIDQVTTQITEMLPGFIELGTQILQALVTSLTNNLPQILESGAAMIGQLVAGLAKAVPQLIAMAPQLIKSLISGFVSAWPQIREAGSQLLTQLGDTIKGGISAAWSWGSDLIANFANGIIEKAQAVWDAVKGVATSIWELLHFSEPEKGPLANFSTYAPDMMRTFAQGIRANEHLVTDAVAGAFDLAPVINAQSSAGRSYNYGGVNVVIYGSQGQSADELYEVFSYRLQQDVARQEVFA